MKQALIATVAIRARSVLRAFLAAIFALSAGAVLAQGVQLSPIPDELSTEDKQDLGSRRAALLQQREAMRAKISGHNIKCGKVPENSPLVAECSGDQASLAAEIGSYQNAVGEFNRLVKAKGSESPSGDPAVRDARNVPSGRTDAGAQLKSVERHSREAQSLRNEEQSSDEARKGFDTPGRASGNLVYPDKNQRQRPPSALDKQIPRGAKDDPQIKQMQAWYRSLDAQKAETAQKIAALKEQQKKGTGDAVVLAAQLGTLTYQSKQIDNDQTKATETVKKRLKNLSLELIESPAPTTTEPKK